MKDAALVLDVIAGYDANDPVTAAAVGQVPETYTKFLTPDGLKGARIGVVRDPLDPRADPTSADFKQVRGVIDRAIADLRRLGADIVEPVAIPDLAARSALYTTRMSMNSKRRPTPIWCSIRMRRQKR